MYRFRLCGMAVVYCRYMEARLKTSIAMTETTKTKLETLKLRLRKAGIPRGEASESAIIEVLVAQADFDAILSRLSR